MEKDKNLSEAKLLIDKSKNNLLINNTLINNKLDNKEKKDAVNVASKVMQIIFRDYNNLNNNIYLNVYKKNKKEKMLNWLERPSLKTDNNIEESYINLSVNNNVEDALDALLARALVLKTSVLRDIRVRNLVLSESLGQGASNFQLQIN